MIKEADFKGERAFFLESDELRVVILPEIGGKIASIYSKDKEFELLFQSKEGFYRKAQLNSSFADYDASGFDDCFPTIDECTVEVSGKEVLYPDHGEIWSSKLKDEISEEKAILKMDSTILPYSYKKTAALKGRKVILDYEIQNNGEEEFPAIWAMHCLVNCEKDMIINFPAETKTVENVHESRFLGAPGTIYNYPVDRNLKGENFDFRRIRGKEEKNTEKYYVSHGIKEGSCSIYYPSKDVTFEINYDSKNLPYLGFWVTEGGFRGDYNCALEPASGYCDSITEAMARGRCRFIKPKEKFIFNIILTLS